MPLKSWGDLLNDAGDAGKTFEPLDDNDYDFVVEEAKHGESSTGKKRYSITARVESGPNAKRKVFHDFYISPENANALGFFFRNMAVLGLDSQFFAANPSDEQVVAKLKGTRFIGTTEKEEWPKESGKWRNRIKTFKTPRPGGAPGPVVQAAGTPAPAPSAAPAPAPVAPAPAPAPAPVAPPAPAAPAVEEATPVVPTPAVDPWADAAGSPGPAAAPTPEPTAPAPAPAPSTQNAPAPPPF